MKTLSVLNPAAGKGTAVLGRTGYITTGIGDCRRFVREECLASPCAHFDVYGGDGTLNEAINGIMDAGTGKTASVKMHPCGSGNDTVKTTDASLEKGKAVPLDLIRWNEGYAVNMLNIGFDCNVVADAGNFKKRYGIAGKLSYILGVIKEFFKPFGEHFQIEAECADGEIFRYEGEAVLCAVCNGQWCGGGFHNSPLSDMQDGLLEMILVRKVSKMGFIRMIGKYKSGEMMDKERREVIDNYKKVVVYKRVRALTLTGCRQICADGEVQECRQIQLSVLPGAVLYRV